MCVPKELQCQKCSKWFVTNHKRKYCHAPCGSREKESIERLCVCCGMPFIATHRANVKYCSRKCAHRKNSVPADVHAQRIAANREAKKRPCKVCGKLFFKGQNKTCSYECGRIACNDRNLKNKKPRAIGTCIYCNSQFVQPLEHKETCSRECWRKIRSIRNRAAMDAINAANRVRFDEQLDARILELRALAERLLVSVESLSHHARCCLGCGVYIGESKRQCEQCTKHMEKLRRQEEWKSGVVTCDYCGKKKHFKSHATMRRFCSSKCGKKLSALLRDERLKENGPVERIGTITLARKSKWTCKQCGCKCVRADGSNASNEATLDHIIPIAKGGTHTWDNVQLLCRWCNSCKSDYILPSTQFMLPFNKPPIRGGLRLDQAQVSDTRGRRYSASLAKSSEASDGRI